MNFGVDGYGTAQELMTLQRKVWAYQPDIVVLAIFLGNDIRNNSVVLEGDQCRPFYVYDKGQIEADRPVEESPLSNCGAWPASIIAICGCSISLRTPGRSCQRRPWRSDPGTSGGTRDQLQHL